jgi:sec-independent protein translocase protein TatC
MVTLAGRRRSGRPPDDEGRMTLVEHVRELRTRLLKAVLAVVVATSVSWFFYDELFHLLSDPYNRTASDLRGRGYDVELTIIGSVVDPFVLQMKVAAYAGIVAASPVWLYQLWAFITPGLHRQERRWTLGFLAMAVPLFLAGVMLCYWALPKGIGILLEFTPQGVATFTNFGDYVNFFLRMLLIFGIGFVMPVFVVLLNAMGVLPASSLVKARTWVVLGIFVFAAVATPTGDPFNMLLVALPMTLLYLAAEVVSRVLDRRRSASSDDLAGLDDDEASPLPTASHQPIPRDLADDRPSRIDDDVT